MWCKVCNNWARYSYCLGVGCNSKELNTVEVCSSRGWCNLFLLVEYSRLELSRLELGIHLLVLDTDSMVCSKLV